MPAELLPVEARVGSPIAKLDTDTCNTTLIIDKHVAIYFFKLISMSIIDFELSLLLHLQGRAHVCAHTLCAVFYVMYLFMVVKKRPLGHCVKLLDRFLLTS